MHTPIHRALAVVLSATVLGPGLCATAHAQTQKLRPGLWENSVTMKSLSGQLEAAMAQMQKSMASLTPAQRKGIARIKDSYEATWMPVLEALAQQGALQAEPGVARLFIFGALNWAVQWFSPKKGKSLDALTDEALALFIRS